MWAASPRPYLSGPGRHQVFWATLYDSRCQSEPSRPVSLPDQCCICRVLSTALATPSSLSAPIRLEFPSIAVWAGSKSTERKAPSDQDHRLGSVSDSAPSTFFGDGQAQWELVTHFVLHSFMNSRNILCDIHDMACGWVLGRKKNIESWHLGSHLVNLFIYLFFKYYFIIEGLTGE